MKASSPTRAASVASDPTASETPCQSEGEPFTNMRAWRDRLGLNTYEAAAALGVSRTLIWELEKDLGTPKRTVRLAMQALAEGSGLERRVAELEADVAALKRLLRTDPAPAPPMPVYAPPGCVCPPGAEFGCGSSGCPRRRYNFGVTT